VKYSPKSSLIHIACQKTSSELLVSVSDNGLGIKSEDRARLFERYYRVETSVKNRIAGFGIGLYLSAEIIQRHDGRIWVESEFGKGSTFYFSLPI
jgi:signal transduction histidine kinase